MIWTKRALVFFFLIVLCVCHTYVLLGMEQVLFAQQEQSVSLIRSLSPLQQVWHCAHLSCDSETFGAPWVEQWESFKSMHTFVFRGLCVVLFIVYLRLQIVSRSN